MYNLKTRTVMIMPPKPKMVEPMPSAEIELSLYILRHEAQDGRKRNTYGIEAADSF